MLKKTLCICVALSLHAGALRAEETRHVFNKANTEVFTLRYFDTLDGNFTDYPKPGNKSTWNLDEQQKSAVFKAVQEWANIIRPAEGSIPAIINIGTLDVENKAGATARIDEADGTLYSSIQTTFMGSTNAPVNAGAHGYFYLGRTKWGLEDSGASQLPNKHAFSLTATAFHELGHALGILTYISRDAVHPVFFEYGLNSYEKLLRDDNGNPAHQGQIVICPSCTSLDMNGFDVRKDKAYLTGQNIQEVLAGAMPGVPVKMTGVRGGPDTDNMSHLELKNSLMSHQLFRNYMTFMEAELAVLEDMGYGIDRRNFYGYSIYNDGQTLVNNHGYFLRDDKGENYIPGQFNTATLGVGLHVYGSHNVVTQNADLLTRGEGGAGIRVDGEGNSIIVNSNTRIYADGQNGKGILFAYGRNHNLIQRGDVEALGVNGIALDFDFGGTFIGDTIGDERGSYFHKINGKDVKLEGYVDKLAWVNAPELNGPLASVVDVSGRVAGRFAAIHQSENALTGSINILKGAQLEGDILSEYNRKDSAGKQRLTQLTFGLKADEQGHSTDLNDDSFRLQYTGNIRGIDAFALSTHGGMTSLNGGHELYSVDVLSGSALSGDSDFTLNKEGRFTNNGVVSPGNGLGAIHIKGDYQQTDSGQLILETDAHGGHDTFAVAGDANLSGRLTFAPLRDWYATGWTTDSDSLLNLTSSKGDFSQVDTTLRSPTLQLNITQKAPLRWQLTMQRQPQAYSQYAQTANAREVGQVLDRQAANSPDAMHKLYSTLDFSSADGNDVSQVLGQLTPAGYSTLFASSLQRERQIEDVIRSRQPERHPGWQSFAQTFGGNIRQGGHADQVGYHSSSYGVIFGADKQSANGDWISGLHGVATHQSVSMTDTAFGKSQSTALSVGAHTRYAPDPSAGTWFYAQTRVGTEDGNMGRDIHLDDATFRQNAHWRGLNASAGVGGGYNWALSDRVSIGPVVGLSYSILSHSALTESGDASTRLAVERSTFSSLSPALGIGSSWNVPLESGSAVKGDMQAVWEHELLSTSVSQNAHFVSDESAAFSSSNPIEGRDALSLKAGVTYQINPTLDIGAGVSSRIASGDLHAIAGNLTANWRF